MSEAEVKSVEPGEPSFTWRFTHTLDKQYRVQCPADWRPPDPNFEFMLIIWPHQPTGRNKAFIMGLTHRRYRDLQSTLDRMSLGDPRGGALRRAILYDAIK